MNQHEEIRFCICGDCSAIVPFSAELHNEDELVRIIFVFMLSGLPTA